MVRRLVLVFIGLACALGLAPRAAEAQLKVDLATLNALLAGRFAELQRRAEGAGVVLKAVVVP